MPSRLTPLVTNHIYHIFNRGTARAPIFSDKGSYQRFLICLDYYRFRNPPTKLSYFLALPNYKKLEIMQSVKNTKNHLLVDILCFCLMPNHFHLLLKQVLDDGITQFINRVGNSYSRYFNTKHDRVGPLFQGVFKSVRIETDEQLIHVSRYIHINPVVDGIIKRQKLIFYPWVSLSAFLGKNYYRFLNIKQIMDYFKSKNDYQQFVYDEVDYQEKQKRIAHLLIESYP